MRRIDKPAPVTVTVEFTEKEAEILCALVGGISCPYRSREPSFAQELFDLLNVALPNRKTTFSDHFEGNVKVKQ